jgi:hypothetical protein
MSNRKKKMAHFHSITLDLLSRCRSKMWKNLPRPILSVARTAKTCKIKGQTLSSHAQK